MRIPTEKIDEVRNATDIIDLIGGFVKLRKRGRNYVGLCPFHVEKTPSFTVSAEKQMYHCFGCGAGGNAFTFVMEMEKVSFAEAVRSLAEKAGISLPRYTSADEAASSEQEQLYDACRTAAIFYHQCLHETAEGKPALEYFHRRGFTDETIRSFGLGYSPNSWDALLKHGQEKGYTSELLEKAGLLRRREDGTFYDYFRGRAMFPIFSTTGRVIGFGARKMREDDPLGKYINSPETAIYNKSRVLYGLSQSKEAVRESDNALLVEGYADLISVFQAGVKNIVASSGTALTEEQTRLIGRYTKNITVVYDADSAGSKAALRGVDLILEQDMDVRVAPLPEGDDPDSFVRKNGGDAFRSLIQRSVSFIDFIGAAFEKEGRLSTPEGKAQTVRAIVRTIAKMSDELKRNFYIKQVAEKYKLYESTLYRELEKIVGEDRWTRSGSFRAVPLIQKELVDMPRPAAAAMPAVERDLIHAMLDGGPEIVRMVFEMVSLEDFLHPQSRSLAAYLLHCVEEGQEIVPSAIVNAVEDPLQRRLITEVLFSRYQISKRWEETSVYVERADARKIATDALLLLRRRSLERLIGENQRSLKESSRRGEDVTPLLERHQQLLGQMKDLEGRSVPDNPGESPE